MPEASLAFSSLIAFAILFGLKHGFDADHLASIDSLARLQCQHGRVRLARYCGLQFAIGHSLVMLVAAAVFVAYAVDGLPQWLNPLGGWISILFLGMIGYVNLRNALRPVDAPLAMSPLVRWVMRLPLPRGMGGGLAVGALFALSFDALSLAAWFGLTGGRHGGLGAALLLALAFGAGMMLTDAINGMVVAGMIRRSQSFARRASRVFSLVVAACALLVAAFGIVKSQAGAVDAWADGKELLFGLLVFGLIVSAYVTARRMSQLALLREP